MFWITKTPLRVSLFGGGTDYPEYYMRHPGAVVGLSIDKYIYIAALRLTTLQKYNYRLSYSQLEHCDRVEDIAHPVVREIIRAFDLSERLDISIISDLPATGSGLGSSSAFTVGFLRAVYAIRGQRPTKIELARQAIQVERELLAENVGVQDQLHAAFGGLNRFDFEGPTIRIRPVQMSSSAVERLNRTMVLVHTGITRRATAAVAAQIEATTAGRIDRELKDLYGLVEVCVDLLEGEGRDWLPELGRMLSESWSIKRSLSRDVSNDALDAVFRAILDAGAYGAKLCGAGGGGFFLALMEPDQVQRLGERIGSSSVVPIRLDVEGSALIHCQTG